MRVPQQVTYAKRRDSAGVPYWDALEAPTPQVCPLEVAFGDIMRYVLNLIKGYPDAGWKFPQEYSVADAQALIERVGAVPLEQSFYRQMRVNKPALRELGGFTKEYHFIKELIEQYITAA